MLSAASYKVQKAACDIKYKIKQRPVFRRAAQTIKADARPEGDRAREAVVGLVLDHLSQAPFGSVEEEGGVDAGGTYFLLGTRQFLRANRCRRRVGGTRCVI